MSWLAIAIFAQLLFAVALTIDKHIVVRALHIGRPIVYAFYISIMSGFVVVIAPFGLVSWPTLEVLSLSLTSSVVFVAGLFFLYSALRSARASDVAPVVGAISALTTLSLAWFLVEGDVGPRLLPSVLLLMAGTTLISHFHFRRHSLLFSLLAGVAFGAGIFFTKLVYNEAGFLDGFFWTRVLPLVVALAMLLVPAWRRAIFHGGAHSTDGSKALVVGNKVISGSASALMAYAVSLGSVTVVNALTGLQFVFLFLFALLFARRMPIGASEKTGSHGGWQTGLGVTLIVTGLALLYLLDGFL